MSARLKLKNLKKRISAIESYNRHCKYEMNRVKNILAHDMQTIGCNIELEPVEMMRDAVQVLEMNVHKAAREISNTWTRQLEAYVRDRISDNYRFDNFGSLAIRVYLPKPTPDFVKVEPMVPRRFF